MQARFGEQRDALGRLVETQPNEVRRGPWRVTFRSAESVCGHGYRLRWRAAVQIRDRGDCAYDARFPREGRYSVRLVARRRGEALSDTQTVTVQDRLIVSLGDSVASGEALPDVPSFDRAIWQSARCHRSARAGPALAAAQIERDDPHSSVTFVHLACSGAQVRHGLLGGYGGVEPPPSEPALAPQVRELNHIADVRPVDAVLISIGANDLGFAPIVIFCSHTSNCFTKPYAGDPTLSGHVASALTRLRGDYGRLGRAISSRIPPRRVRIVDYFDPTHDERGETCRSILLGVSRGELEQAQKQVLEPLNRAVAEDTPRGWRRVTGLADRFREHGYCAKGQPWVTTLSHSAVALGGRFKGRFFGTLHPNDTGQAVIGGAIAAELERSFFPGEFIFRPPPPSDSDEGGGGVSTVGVVLIALGALLLVYAVAVLSPLAAVLEKVVASVALGVAAIALVAVAIGLRDNTVTAVSLGIAGGALAGFALPRWRP